jgi:hypothetical protein
MRCISLTVSLPSLTGLGPNTAQAVTIRGSTSDNEIARTRPGTAQRPDNDSSDTSPPLSVRGSHTAGSAMTSPDATARFSLIRANCRESPQLGQQKREAGSRGGQPWLRDLLQAVSRSILKFWLGLGPDRGKDPDQVP